MGANRAEAHRAEGGSFKVWWHNMVQKPFRPRFRMSTLAKVLVRLVMLDFFAVVGLSGLRAAFSNIPLAPLSSVSKRYEQAPNVGI